MQRINIIVIEITLPHLSLKNDHKHWHIADTQPGIMMLLMGCMDIIYIKNKDVFMRKCENHQKWDIINCIVYCSSVHLYTAAVECFILWWWCVWCMPSMLSR